MLSPQYVAPSPRRVLNSLPTLATPDPQEARERVSALFCPHDLKALGPRGSVKMSLRTTGAGFGIHILDYGAAVRISPQALETFFMVQVPLAGRAELTVGSTVFDSDPQTASVPPIDRDFSMTWQSGTPQLIITAPRQSLTHAAESLYGAGLQALLHLAPTMDTSTAAGQSFIRAVYDYHDLLNESPAPANSYTRRLHEEMVLARWLLATQSNYSSSLAQWEQARPSAGTSDLVADFLAVLEAHSNEDLTMGDLAEALGVSVRTLQIAVSRETGSTPSQMLRDARLRHAHQLLLEATPGSVSVTDIAERCGFGHLGRFAREYRRYFGFLPSQTLRR
ncbi:AraC family transcriptional regulator [Glutamicibacter sp. MNS18]|uniref:AraC family transcriptional regulator n=1 Tax=Glutamicibacter sp. MNS18 TaxID=2989817 RepID=UPI00223685DA|nr:AraC family transcriptional regulator [Glutamicibacter sp. MNS18]MCW4465301.1 AraC family transcriptional regulator [Glutamicibacter sp. MNS18]